MENLLTKLMIYAVLFIAGGALLKIGSFYLLHKLAKEKAYANYNKKDLEELHKRKIKQQIELEDILRKGELQPYYKQAKDSFNEAIKSSNLTREQILFLKKVINESLGDFINDYKDIKFKNDAHEIYSKLKCSHIKIPDFKKFIQLIKTFEAQNDGVILTLVEEKKRVK